MQLGVRFSENILSSVFADDFVEVAETGSTLQSLINTVHNDSKCWYFEANVKSVPLSFFSKYANSWVSECEVMKAFLFLDFHFYIGIEFSSDGLWDKHIKSLVVHNKQKLGGLYRFFS